MSTQIQKTNTVGTKYCLVTSKDGMRGLVHKLCANYSQGSTGTAWRVCAPRSRMTQPENNKIIREGLEIKEATELFNRLLKSRKK